MLRNFPRIRRSRSRANGGGTKVRPVRIAVASILAATASVFVITAVASAHDVYSTTVYSGGTTVYDGSSPDGPSYTNGLQGTSGTTGTAISNNAILNAPATVYDTAKVQNESSNTSVTMTFNLYFGSVPTGCPTTGPNTNKTPIPSGWLQQEVIPANPSPSFPEYTASWGGHNWLYGTSVSPTFNTITTPGNYYFVAYTPYDDPSSGLNFTFGITCEPFTVQGKASPSINTVPSSGPSPSSIALGQSFTDTATLTGANSPNGSITFDVYNNANCTGTVLFTSTNGLSGNSATSGSYTPPSAGSYYIAASYPGDGNNNSASSACSNEVVTVNKASPGLNTVPSSGASPSSIGLGQSFTDTATLTGAHSPTGSITFDVYNNANCTGTVLFTSTNGLSGNSATSGSYTPPSAGSYYIAASYPGDGNNNSASSACSNEVVTVGKGTPSVTTALLTSSLSPYVGLYDDDVATVSGGHSPNGYVTFNIYTTNNCSGAIWNTSTNSLSGTSPNGPTAQSNSFGPFTPGVTYYFDATYNGDSNNSSASSPCASEPVTVTKTSPGMYTTLSGTSVNLGGSFSDSATLTSAVSPTGSVTFNVYTSNACSGTPLFTSTGTLSGLSAPSGSFGPLNTAGTYYVAASYPGDANNGPASSPCTAEVVTVTKTSPGMFTTLSGTSVNLGGSFSDSATLTGALSPTGSVTFNVYTSNACSGTPLFTSTGALSGSTAPSGSFGPLNTAGSYYVSASYPGDTNNGPASSPCTAEVVTVGKTSPSLSTTLSATTVNLGGSFSDSATLTGALSPTGSVTFNVYTSNACSGTPLFTSTGALSGSTAPSGSFGPLNTAGSYYVSASYPGDTNNGSASSPCTAEVVTVGVTSPSLSTTLSAASVNLGGSFSDSATLTGALSPTGSVTFNVYTSNACSGTPLFTSTGALSGSTAPSGSFGPLNTAGSYYVSASYPGDTNNGPASSPCTAEVVTVGVTSPSLSTTLSAASVNLGGSFSDSATLTGALSPTGSVTFNVYTSNACSGTPLFTSTGALSGSTAPSGSFGPLNTAGSYYVSASYPGDTNNGPASSPCTAEVVTVGKTSPSLSTTLSATTVNLGGSFSDSATLTGALSPTGSVTFNVYTSNACSGTPLFTSTGALSGSTAPSGSFGPLNTAGSYYVSASYPGDTNNGSASSPCTAEVVTVGVTSPSVSTTLSAASVNLGGSFSDSATLTGALSPTGSVTFNVYTSNACSGTPLFTATGTLSGLTAQSGTFGPLSTVGSYYVAASYPGDTNNGPASSPCTAEVVTVTAPSCTSGCGGGGGGPPTASLATTPSVTGLSATDSATVTGTGGTPTGSVTFTLYSGTSPSGTLVTAYAADTVTLNGSGTATSVSTGPLTPGSYYFLVTYSGDSNYAKITPGTAEPFSINPNVATTPAVTGSSATDTANVTGTLGTPTGTVTFVLYSGSPGSGTLVAGFAPETVTLVNGSATSTSTGSLAAGNYYFEVSYSGDSNYPAITPGSPEPFTIIVTSPPTPVYKIPTSAPQTGAGGMARVTFDGGLLALGSLMLLAGLSAMALMLRRRRNA
jgi:hypothetical protein